MKILRAAVLPLLLATTLVVCKQVDLTAPTGAEIRLSAQPLSVNFSGTSTLTVVGTREGGAPLPDGTVIRFTVDDNLGAITPNPVETRNGIATATFIAGQRSGTAVIEAFSGDAISEEVTIDIGEARVERLILTADPASLPPEGGNIQLRAFVKDEQGNPVSGVQVFFQTTSGTLTSKGDAVLTNPSGVARDTLKTTEDATVTVVAGAQEDQLNITLGTEVAPTCGVVASTTSAAVGQDISFLDTSEPGDNPLDESSWDFGDGDDANGLSVSHSYSSSGSFLVLHTITDTGGLSDNCEPIVIDVQEGEAPVCSFDVAPSGDVNAGQSVSFVDTSTDADGTISQSSWEFGDGDSANGTSVSHTYTDEGSFIVLHTVTDSQGISTSCTATVNVLFPGTAPTCTFTRTNLNGRTATYDGSDSTDNDEGGSSIVTFEWNLGDNSTDNGPIVNHQYAAAGTYTVVLTITDDEGDTATCSQQSIIP